jgi:3-oxoacyl-[acyl-carrier-protein] synthase II
VSDRGTGSLRDNPVVVTGVGAVTALGHTAAKTWNGLLSAKDGVRPVEGFNVQGFDCKMAAQVRGLDPEAVGIHTKSARLMDKHSFMLMKCARDAFTQARLGGSSVAEDQIGFFAGMGMVDYKIEDLVPAVVASKGRDGALDMEGFYSKGYEEIYPLIILLMLNNVSLCQAAIDLRIRGENAVFSPHADSGACAIAESLKTLAEGRARVVLAGGVSEKVSPFGLARAHLQGNLNTGGDKGLAVCHPFGAHRQGTVLGEGCGILALELRASADERRVPYASMITGCGAAFGCEERFSAPTCQAMTQAMRAALESAALGPSEIDVLIAHGDGTKIGDQNEISAIHEVFVGCLDRILVFSSKGALGHLLAAAPAVDVIIGVSMLTEGIVPTTLHAVPVDQSAKFHVVNGGPVRTSSKRVMVNCRGDSGQCASLIVETVR